MPRPSDCVVVVEDEFEILQLLHDMLEIEGIVSVGVGRPDLVWEVAKRKQPCLFLIDIMLPGTSGVEVAQALRSSGFAATPMIAMSASRTMQQVAKESGLFDATIGKPFNFELLFSYIQRLMDGAVRER